MIEIEHITKRYGDTTVLDDLSLTISTAGVTSLIGPNGAGKSTLLSIVGRLLEADGGRVRVDGLDVATTPSRTLAERLAILRQENRIAVRLTVRELVELGRFPYSRGRLSVDDSAAVDAAIDALALEPFAARRLDQLSGGQRQRAFIAMVLAQDTDYVLLDEPLNNLDLRHAAQSMAHIRRLADELDKAVVVVLHDINVAAQHSDRIVAMKEGRVTADGTPEAVVVAEVLEAVYDTPIRVAEVDGSPVALPYAAERRQEGEQQLA